MSYPKRGKTSEDGKYYTHTDGRVCEVFKSTIGSWETCALCSFKSECRGGKVVDCGNLQYFRVIEFAYVPSADEITACIMVREAIEMCASRAEGGCMDCPHDEYCDNPCVLRHYLCKMRRTDAWDMGDKPVEFEPCDVCGGTEANFDGFCSHCELPMEPKQEVEP